MADGWISGRILGVTVDIKDKEHIDKFKDFLKSSHTTYYTKNGQYGISIRNNNLISKLKEYNIIPRKSLIATPPESLINNRDFWRGMVDGDGSIWFSQKYYNIGMYGAENIVSQFRSYNISLFGKIFSPIFKKKTIYGFQTNGTKALKVIKNLYNTSAISLDRKQKLADMV
jgi:hypothetical protein